MPECPNCDVELDEDDFRYECPFCGYEDGEGFYYCYNCDFTFDEEGDTWICENCENEGVNEEREREIIFFDIFDDDDDCEELIPDVNQGWVGEHYG